MSNSPRRPAPAGHSKTDLRRGQLTPAPTGPRPATAKRPPLATSGAEQTFLFDDEGPAPAATDRQAEG